MTAGVFRGLVELITAEELLDQAASKPCPMCGTAWETVTAVWNERWDVYSIQRTETAHGHTRSHMPAVEALRVT
jgi:hypothetical protein